MSDASVDFMALSRVVANEFLHTVVFVDDQAFYTEKEKSPTHLSSPTRKGRQVEEVLGVDSGGARNPHKLDAKEVTDEFVSKGLVCSVLKPFEGQNPLDIVNGAVKRADVFILDWKINDDDGVTALTIIEKIISYDSISGLRLRLVIIYTGEPGIISISNLVKKKMAEQFGDDFKEDDGGFSFNSGHLRIAIFVKEGVTVLEEYNSRVLSVSDLADQLSGEFAKITSGLVSNVALKSMSVLRDNTHLILGRLGPQIDPSYLSHRALLPNPDDAMNLVIDIIASEFYSIMESYKVGNEVDLQTIKAWLKHFNPTEKFTIHLLESTKEINLENMLKFLENDFDKTRKEINRGENDEQKKMGAKSFKNFTKTFCFNKETSSDELDCKFSMLTSLKNRYEGVSNPVLTLGTILKEESTDFPKYWLCIMPRCDCVRFEEKRNFFFLFLEKVGINEKFDIVVLDDENNFVKLKINNKIYNSQFTHFEFVANDSNQVQSKEEAENHIFIAANEEKRFKWVSELKREHAQRIVNNLASEISRVGLDESEWQRRWASHK
jgi:hypothetical protein